MILFTKITLWYLLQHCADCMMFLVSIRHPKHKRIHFDEIIFFKYADSTDDDYEEYLHSE